MTYFVWTLKVVWSQKRARHDTKYEEDDVSKHETFFGDKREARSVEIPCERSSLAFFSLMADCSKKISVALSRVL